MSGPAVSFGLPMGVRDLDAPTLALLTDDERNDLAISPDGGIVIPVHLAGQLAGLIIRDDRHWRTCDWLDGACGTDREVELSLVKVMRAVGVAASVLEE